MIEIELLKKYGATYKKCGKDEFIFYEGDSPTYYYQIVSGEIKMSNLNDEGKEFVQGIFSGNRSFGEPPLFGDFTYPANAISLDNSEILRLEKSRFFKLLEENPSIYIEFLSILSKRIHYKAIMMSEIANHNSAEKIMKLIDFLKMNIYNHPKDFLFEVELTRKQIAELTGLRIETVIKTIRSLEKKNELQILNGKVFR